MSSSTALASTLCAVMGSGSLSRPNALQGLSTGALGGEKSNTEASQHIARAEEGRDSVAWARGAAEWGPETRPVPTSGTCPQQPHPRESPLGQQEQNWGEEGCAGSQKEHKARRGQGPWPSRGTITASPSLWATEQTAQRAPSGDLQAPSATDPKVLTFTSTT